MGKFLCLLFSILISNSITSSAQNCNSYSFSNNIIYATCVTLPVQNSHLHWNYHPANGTVDLAFRHTGVSTSEWVAWALNVNGSGMVGAQSLVALPNSNGSVRAYTSSVTGYGTTLQQSPLSFDVPAIRAERVNGDVVIYATVVLPGGRTSFNQVWQIGPVANGAPSAHPLNSENRNSFGTVDFVTGQAGSGGGNDGASSAQNCNSYSFSNNIIYATCVTLPVQNSHLHWNYHPANGTVDLAFRHTGVSTSEWVAWALNVDGSGMVGAQALVALPNSNGSVRAYTSSVTGYGTTLQQSPLSFVVPAIRAERVNGDVVIYATVVLPGGRTSFNQVWQIGPVANGAPSAHPMNSENRNSFGTVDFVTGQAGSGGGNVGGSRLHRRNTHGVLNAVSWGVLMPMGAMVARYLKVFKVAHPAWFYIHVACQASAYSVGVAGWGTGLKLGSDSPGIKYTTHRNIGITLFALGTLQVFALLLRPKPDNKYRIYWNIYHGSIGYTVIALGIVNVFKGLDILDPEKKWKHAYIGVIISLGAIAAILEAFTWFIVLKRKQEEKRGPVGDGTNRANVYGNGHRHGQAP